MFSWLAKISLGFGAILFSFSAFAQVDDAIFSYAPEVSDPTTVEEAKDKLSVPITSDVNIEVPNTDNIAFFETELDLSPDGDVFVQERFFVVVTEDRRNQPLVRRINRFVKTPVKEVSVVPDITSAYHNGNIVPYRVEPGLKYTDVYIGNGEIVMYPGIHTFSLNYTVKNLMQNINGYKLFAWDIIGDGWKIPVLHTSLSVKHPFSTVPTGQSIFYGGMIDQKIRNYSDKGDGTSYNFLKNDIINPGRNLVFVESFGKEAFPALDSKSVYEGIFDFNIYALICLFGLAMVVAYYTASWFTCGREKRKILNPSLSNSNEKFFSPAALRLFVKSTMDSKLLSVMLIKLAEKGLIKIEERKDNTFVFVRQAAHKKKSGLSAGERMFFACLFPKKGALNRPLDKSLGAKITNRRRVFELPLLNEFNTQYLRANYPYFLFGLFVMFACIAVNMFIYDGSSLLAIMMGLLVLATLLSVGCGVVLANVLKKVRGKKEWIKVVVAFIVFVGLVSLTIYCASKVAVLVGTLAAVFTVLMAVVTAVSYTLFKSEKKLGKVLNESTKLYRNYLSLNMAIPSSGSKMYELYSRHITYALALDLENDWAKRFGVMFTSLRKDDFSWYSGNAPLNQTFIADLVRRLNAALEENVTFLNPNVQKFK